MVYLVLLSSNFQGNQNCKIIKCKWKKSSIFLLKKLYTLLLLISSWFYEICQDSSYLMSSQCYRPKLPLYTKIIQFYESSHSHVFFKRGVLKNFANIRGKHLCWSLFLIKLQAFRLLRVAELPNYLKNIWDKVFKSGLSKFCGRQSLKNLLSPLLNLEHFISYNQ